MYANLKRHDPRYPTPDKLRSITWQGRDGTWGTTNVGTTAKPLDQVLGVGKDSEASDALISVVDRSDPRPVWVCVWGGTREVAQAVWKVRATRSPGLQATDGPAGGTSPSLIGLSVPDNVGHGPILQNEPP